MNKPMSSVKVMIRLLGCVHAPYFYNDNLRPKVGDILYCRDCRKDRVVWRIDESFWTKCLRCKYANTRYFGRAEKNAEIAAVKHRRRFPHHTVLLYDGETLVHTFEESRYQLTLDGDQPPF